MKNTIKNIIETLHITKPKHFIDVYNADTGIKMVSRYGIENILSKNHDAFNWFLDLPARKIQIRYFLKNGSSFKEKPKSILPIIDLDQVRQEIETENNKKQNNVSFGLNGATGLNAPQLMAKSMMYDQLKAENENLKNALDTKVTKLQTKLEKYQKKISKLKQKQLYYDIASENKPLLGPEQIKSIAPMVMEFLKQAKPQGLGQPVQQPQENLTETQKQFINYIKTISDDEINVISKLIHDHNQAHTTENQPKQTA